MKKVFAIMLAVLLLGAVPVSAAEMSRTISVTGSGIITVKPDIAVLSIGVTTTGETTDVQQENVITMNKVIDVIKEHGVAEEDIETTGYSLNPNYDYQSRYTNGSYKIIGYTMRQTIRVTVRDVTKAGEILSDATEAGANINNGISFTLSDPGKYYYEALAAAMDNAKNKATVIAGSIGITLSAPYGVSERSSYSYVTARAATGNYMSDAVMEAPSAMPAQIEAGEMEVSAQVSVEYRY